jgi:hypothetical protein
MADPGSQGSVSDIVPLSNFGRYAASWRGHGKHGINPGSRRYERIKVVKTTNDWLHTPLAKLLSGLSLTVPQQHLNITPASNPKYPASTTSMGPAPRSTCSRAAWAIIKGPPRCRHLY